MNLRMSFALLNDGAMRWRRGREPGTGDTDVTLQQESRSRLTRMDFQRRGATEAQRTALSEMWGKSHADRGIYIPSRGERVIHDARSKEERWCERCKRIGRIMCYMGTKSFRCCGWPA